MRNRLFWGLLLAAFIAVPLHAGEWSKTYKVTGHPSLRFDTNDGAISLVSSNAPEIQANIVAQGWDIGREIQITESQAGNSVDIRMRVPEFEWHLFSFNRRSIRVEIRVPRESDLDLHTGDGNVRVDYVVGRIKVDTGDGHISAQELKGEIRMHTGDGRIEGAGFDGSLNADTGDGQINVHGRFDALQLRTGDGSVEAAAEAGSAVAQDWSISTGDGNIHLRIPPNVNTELRAHTGDGRIRVDLPFTVSGTQNRTNIRGKIGTGGATVSLETGDGSITVQRL
jgi:DUF4097 and DUF4098 domain-containing protein YvlB